MVRRGNWSQDIGYFLVGALTEADRRRAERDLLNEYRQALVLPVEAKPSADEIWRLYRASAAYGLAVWLSTLGTDGWQAPAISTLLVQRYAAAFAELDTAQVLVSAD